MVKMTIPGVCFSFLAMVSPVMLWGQQIQMLDSSQKTASFRGLSVVSDQVVWVSGSKGTVGRSTNGGVRWTWMKPEGFDTRDFRDIEAFDSLTAIIMAVDRPALILKTKDGGQSWFKVYERDIPGIFLDAMSFKDAKRGICVGDPINEHFWILETYDGGDSWTEFPLPQAPLAFEGEALFASSGSNIQFVTHPQAEYAFVTGGTISRLHLMSGKKGGVNGFLDLGMPRGRTTMGANTLAVQGDTWMIMGGDFNLPMLDEYNTYFTLNNTKSWNSPGIQPPFGYKSSAVFKDENTIIATGTAGTDISLNNLHRWKHFSDTGFHVVQKAKKGNAIYFAGPGGAIGKLLP